MLLHLFTVPKQPWCFPLAHCVGGTVFVWCVIKLCRDPLFYIKFLLSSVESLYLGTKVCGTDQNIPLPAGKRDHLMLEQVVLDVISIGI